MRSPYGLGGLNPSNPFMDRAKSFVTAAAKAGVKGQSKASQKLTFLRPTSSLIHSSSQQLRPILSTAQSFKVKTTANKL